LEGLLKIPIGDLILWFVVFLFSLSCHEASHALTSEWFGDYTGRYQGRISLNPMVHIDPIGTILIPLMGFMNGGFAMFGWAKPVQTNPLLWRDKTKANIMVSAAGPISNFIIASVAFAAIKIMLMTGVVMPAYSGHFDIVSPVPPGSALMSGVTKLLSIMLTLNVTLGVFNLLPVPPLDGSHVLESLLPYEMAKAYEQIRPYGFILLLALLWTPVLGWIIGPVYQLVGFLLFGS
jgi:Zn-dependent protease